MDWSSSSSSSSDDSDVEEMILDEDADNLVLLHLMDKFENGRRKSVADPRLASYAFPATELSVARCS